MESVRVPEGCPLAGRSLRELDLIRRAGVQIGGIRRGKHRTLALQGEDRFEPGDELLLLGTHAQIKSFCSLLAPAGEPGAPAPPTR
jgi:Trk K+ transport system NAD-binding subunit